MEAIGTDSLTDQGVHAVVDVQAHEAHAKAHLIGPYIPRIEVKSLFYKALDSD